MVFVGTATLLVINTYRQGQRCEQIRARQTRPTRSRTAQRAKMADGCLKTSPHGRGLLLALCVPTTTLLQKSVPYKSLQNYFRNK